MNRLHELFLIVLDVFNLATSRGFYFLPFLFAIAYLILSDDEKHKRTITFLLAPTALGMLILLSPFVPVRWALQCTDRPRRPHS